MAESDTPSVDGLMRVLDVYGIRHGGECSDPAKPYSITVKVPGRGQTNCCGATVREAAQSAFDWLYALPLSPGDSKSELPKSANAHATSQERDDLQTALPEDTRDAKRYRWLRDVSVPPHNFYISVPDEFHGRRYSRAEVDAYIDAAMKGGQ